MKNKIILLYFVIFCSTLYSQVEIKQNELPKGTLNESDLWKFNAKNTGKENLEVVYAITVTYNDSLLYDSGSKSYPLSSGESQTYQLKFNEQPLQNWQSNILKRMIMREGDFLPGEYKICMTAYAANDKKQPDKNKPLGSECVNHTVVNFENEGVIEIKPKKPTNSQLLISDLWNFTAVNKSKTKLIVEIYFLLTYNGSDLCEGVSRGFVMKPGESGDFNFKYNEAAKTRWLIEPKRDSILQSGKFPTGEYKLCLTARSEWSGKEYGNNCIDITVEEKKDK